jgi:RNA polymerase sigma factor (sigma-70 family)
MNKLEPAAAAAMPGASGAPAPAADHATPRHQRLTALFIAARGGHRDSLEEIVAELSPLLWHVARAQGLDYETAQDAVQYAWLRLVQDLERIREPAALTAWLVTTVKREAWRIRAAARTETPSPDAAIAQGLPPVPGAEDDVLLTERHREVWRAVHRLPERCRNLLRVVAFTPRPDYDQVSAALDMPRGSVGPTRARCLDKLRDLMET